MLPGLRKIRPNSEIQYYGQPKQDGCFVSGVRETTIGGKDGLTDERDNVRCTPVPILGVNNNNSHSSIGECEILDSRDREDERATSNKECCFLPVGSITEHFPGSDIKSLGASSHDEMFCVSDYRRNPDKSNPVLVETSDTETSIVDLRACIYAANTVVETISNKTKTELRRWYRRYLAFWIKRITQKANKKGKGRKPYGKTKSPACESEIRQANTICNQQSRENNPDRGGSHSICDETEQLQSRASIGDFSDNTKIHELGQGHGNNDSNRLQLVEPNPIRLAHEEEFTKSAIHPDLCENFITLEKNADIQNILFVGNIERTNTGRVAGNYLQKYGNLNSGWYCGTLGSDYVQFKPDEQYRRIDKDGDKIKYENPPKFPSDIFRLKYIPTWLARQLGCDVESQNFWDWVNSNNCKHGWITEGAKKTASLLSSGKTAIGLAGINNLYNKSHDDDGKEIKTPIPSLVEFIKDKEEITIALDAPDKLSQIQGLKTAIEKIREFIFKYGSGSKCKINLAVWDWKYGKGIDDVIYNGHADKIQVVPYYEALRFINTNIPASKLIQGQEYLSLENVENFTHKYTGIKAPKNSGKSYVVAQFLGGLCETIKVLSITFRIKLGQQLAERFGLYYINDETSVGERALKGHRLSLCINSLHSKKGIHAEDWKDCILILDEVVQLINHITDSGTLGGKSPEIIRNFIEILRNAQKVIFLDADLDYKTLNILAELLADSPNEKKEFFKKFKIYQFEKEAEKAPMTVHFASNQRVGAMTFEEALNRLLKGEKVLINVDSKRKGKSKVDEPKIGLGAEIMVNLLKKEYEARTGNQLKAVAMTADTVKIKEHDACEIAQSKGLEKIYEYDLVVYTTVLGTGVSLEKPHFDVVIGGYVGGISIDEILQALYRYRQPVERVVFLPNKGMRFKRDGSTYSAKENRFNTSMIVKENLQVYASLTNSNDEENEINRPFENYHAELRAIGRLESDNYLRFFLEKAKEDYEVDFIDPKEDKEKGWVIPKTTKETIEEMVATERTETLNASILPVECVQENSEGYEFLKAKEILTKNESNTLNKYKLLELYGLEQNPDLLDEELWNLHNDNRNYYSEIRTHYFLNNPENARTHDEFYNLGFNGVEAKGNSKFKHQKSKNFKYLKAQLLNTLGVKELIEVEGEVIDNEHPVVLDIIANYLDSSEAIKQMVKRHLNIEFNESKPMKFIISLALKVGMIKSKSWTVRTPDRRQSRQSVFTIPDSKRYQLFEIWDKHYEEVRNSMKAIKEMYEQQIEAENNENKLKTALYGTIDNREIDEIIKPDRNFMLSIRNDLIKVADFLACRASSLLDRLSELSEDVDYWKKGIRAYFERLELLAAEREVGDNVLELLLE